MVPAVVPARPPASLQDVWVNTLGAAIGTVLAYAWLERRRNRRPVTR